MKSRVVGLAFGVAFGFWLCWARFTRYDVILGGLRFQELYLWLMFGAAVLTAGVGLRLLRMAGARTAMDGQPVAWTTTPVRSAHILGSAMFGIGWAVAGTCPGPAAAQIGHGQLAGLFTAGGIFAGVWLQGRLASRRSAAERQAMPTGACAQA